MKKKLSIFSAVVLIALTVSFKLFSSVTHIATNRKTVVQPSALAGMVAGPGLVEPVSENIQVGSELAGKLKSVNVEEGDSIRKGQVLAVLESEDYRAQLASATAEVQAKQAVLRKVVNGARGQERSEAQASVRAAQAIMENAQADLARRQALFDAGLISREELEHYQREYDVAKSQRQQNADRSALRDADAREEDVALAQADLQLVKAHLADAQAKYEKTIIRSPIDGTVLRRQHRTGENVSNSATQPDPVLTIGDIHVLRVRVDIDETDVNRVRAGQKAYVTADAFGTKKFSGHVVQIGQLLGPKNVSTGQPTERVDRKFLEVLIELNPGVRLPPGLRVDSFIVNDAEQTAALQ